jgi:hypothetical protein
MTTRRDLLKGLLGAGVVGLGEGRLRAAKPVPSVIRVGLDLPPGAAARGAALAGDEARQTAGLLGTRFELTTAGAANLFAVVGWRAPAEEPRTLFLVAGPPGDAPAPVRRVFQVGSDPLFRREALARKGGKGFRALDWHPDLKRFGAEQLNERYLRRFGMPMDEAAWRGWVAVKIAAELALRNAGADPTAERFDGHKGVQLRFDPDDHTLIQPVYIVDGKGKLVGRAVPEGEE